MEIDYRKENAKRNIKIVIWIIIAINALGIYQGAGGNPVINISYRPFRISTFDNSINHLYGLSLQTGIMLVLSFALSIAVIIFAVRALKFSEQARSVLVKLLLLDIVLHIVYFFLEIGLMVYPAVKMPFHNYFNWVFFLMAGVTSVINIAAILIIYVFYRFLSKPDTKAVFVTESLNN